MAKQSSAVSKDTAYKEDIIFFRMSCVFVLCIAAVFFYRHLYTNIDLASDIYIISRKLSSRIIAVLLSLLSVGYYAFCRYKKKDESKSTFSSGNLACLVCYISGGFLYWGTTYSVRYDALITLTIGFSLLYFIYHIYKIDFFAFSASNLLFLSTAWLFTRGAAKFLIFKALFLALCVLACFMTYKAVVRLAANNKQRKTKKVFHPVVFSFLITVVLISLSKFIGVPFITSSLMFNVIIAQYLVGGIYYTVKLFREDK